MLVGHSYGGMVITGVADHIPAQVDSLASFLQRLKLSGDLGSFRRRDLLYALQWRGDSPLRPSYERVKDDPAWTTHELDGKHNLMRDRPEELVRILLDVDSR